MKHTQKGAVTAEAALVIPVVILILFYVIQMCILQYQTIVLSAQAMRTAAKAEHYFKDYTADNFSSVMGSDSAANWITWQSFADHDIYGNPINKLSQTEFSDLLNRAFSMLYSTENNEEEDTQIVWQITNGILFQKKIRATMTKRSLSPLQNLYQGIGLNPKKEQTSVIEVPYMDQTGFISDLALIYDLLQQLKQK